MDSETQQVLLFVLQQLKQQVLYLHRQHGWLIAIAETLEKEPGLVEHLKQHPFYDQGPEPRIAKSHLNLENIDLLIQRLSDRKA